LFPSSGSVIVGVMAHTDLSSDAGSAPLEREATRRHLDDTVRVWLGVRRGADVPPLPDVFARQLLRLEEYERPTRDPWGCWDYEYSESHRVGLLREPTIDRWLAGRRRALAGEATPLWPPGKSFAVCLTHDVDLVSTSSTIRQVGRFARAGRAPGIAGRHEAVARLARPPVRVVRSLGHRIARSPSTARTMERSVAVEAKRGAFASYFFTVPPGTHRSRYDCVYAPDDRCTFRGKRVRIADLMRALDAEGHDVGLHGSYAAALEPGVLTAERAFLRNATGLEITTTRQHFLRWDVRYSADFQEAAGLRADSSLGFNRNVGFRAGTSLPFHPFDVDGGRRLELLEVPLVIQDTALLGRAALALDLDGARKLVGELIDAIAAVEGVATLLFHPDKLARPDWLALYEHALDHALDRGGWLTSLRTLQEWWSARETALLAE
jgi:hypothetical protein